MKLAAKVVPRRAPLLGSLSPPQMSAASYSPTSQCPAPFSAENPPQTYPNPTNQVSSSREIRWTPSDDTHPSLQRPPSQAAGPLLLGILFDLTERDPCGIFASPVDPVAWDCPTYYGVILEPMGPRDYQGQGRKRGGQGT